MHDVVLLAENEEKRGHVDVSIGRRVILKWILSKSNWTICTALVWLRIRIRESSCEHGNEGEV